MITMKRLEAKKSAKQRLNAWGWGGCLIGPNNTTVFVLRKNRRGGGDDVVLNVAAINRGEGS